MCPNCQRLIAAIERYIEKADNDLTDDLKAEGYVEPADTAKVIDDLEADLEAALTDETDYIVTEAGKKSTLEEVASSWADIQAADTAAQTIAAVTEAEFTKCMPEIITAYLQQTDHDLTLTTISARTTDWIHSWSGELGNIMQLDSHKEIEKILSDGLEKGKGVGEFIVDLQDSGIRNEYYRARRVAVTEVLRAHSVAQQEAFDQDPAVAQKMWRHTGSYRNDPRPNHVDMDGQIVDKDEPFVLIGADGGIYHPMYPRDTSLPPGESINCHCICQPIVDEAILGMSLEDRMALQQEAIEEMDDEWEAELNAQRMLASLLG